MKNVGGILLRALKGSMANEIVAPVAFLVYLSTFVVIVGIASIVLSGDMKRGGLALLIVASLVGVSLLFLVIGYVDEPKRKVSAGIRKAWLRSKFGAKEEFGIFAKVIYMGLFVATIANGFLNPFHYKIFAVSVVEVICLVLSVFCLVVGYIVGSVEEGENYDNSW